MTIPGLSGQDMRDTVNKNSVTSPELLDHLERRAIVVYERMKEAP